jgi:thiamine-monophosphate kinase
VVGVNLDEFGLIRHLTARLGKSPAHVRVGIGDDAAVLAQRPGEDWLVTTDALVEGVHFLKSTMRPADIGFKALAVSISDIAAMGGEPRGAVLSLAIPKSTWPLPDLEALYDGVAEACAEYGCPLVGGDVVSTSGPLVLTSTVFGAVPEGEALLRSSARPGDVVFVTGTVGASAAGLEYLLQTADGGDEVDQSRVPQGAQADRLTLPRGSYGGVGLPPDEVALLVTAHRRPRPQVLAGRILREAGAHACDDISDGLASELNEIAEASSVRLRISAARIPILPAVNNFARRCGKDPLEYALYGGEDFQLVGTAPPLAFARALARCEGHGVRLTQIGRVEAGDGVVAELPDGRLDIIEPRGYNHFRDDEAEDGRSRPC